MKRGGQVIYAGPLGRHSQKLIEYFEVSKEVVLFHIRAQLHVLSSLSQISAAYASNHSNIHNLLQAISGVPKIKNGYNPATWMLEISTPSVEAQLGIDFADIHANSNLYQ